MAICLCCRRKMHLLKLDSLDMCKSCIKAGCTTKLRTGKYGILLEGSCNLQDKNLKKKYQVD